MGKDNVLYSQYAMFLDGFKTGLHPVTQEKLTLRGDYLDTALPNIGPWLPKVMQTVVREAVEPSIVLTPLLNRVGVQGGTVTISMGMGALVADDIAEGQSYPESQLQIGGATTTAQIGKSGLRVKFTHEAIERSQFDLVNAHLAAAGRALIRHKEQKIANFINSIGNVVFDNASPSTSLKGVTHGRDIAADPNGSLIWDDLFDLFGAVINNGFMPNTILMHPMTWVIWMKDPVLRTFAINAGGGTWWGAYQGQPHTPAPWDGTTFHTSKGQSTIPASAANGSAATPTADYPQNMNVKPTMPGYMLPFPVNIVVSPFVYYDAASLLTDIIVFDSRELGTLLVEEEPTIEERDIFDYDMREIKIREKYGVMINEEGLGVAVARNIKVTANEIVLPAMSTVNPSTISAISATTAVV